MPPSPEQTRIADRIDELFTDFDAAVAALLRIRKKLPRYRAALLHAAVTGRLTREWRTQHGPAAESGAALLERILKARREAWERRTLAKYQAQNKPPPKGWQSRYQEPAPPDTKDLPELPEGWCWATLDQISDVTGGVAKNQKDEANPNRREVPYLRVANVQNGYLDLTVIRTVRATEDDIKELTLRPGDVLLTEGGDRNKLGRGWVWEGQIDECIHQNHIFRARLYLSDVAPELISHAGNGYGREWFLTNGKQSVNLASISLGVARQFPVPLAPVEEQGAVMERLTEKLSQIDAMESEIERGLKRAARLRQAILKAAFAGRLVPQDPSDEPASVLLERLKALREQGQSRRPRRGRAVAGANDGE